MDLTFSIVPNYLGYELTVVDCDGKLICEVSESLVGYKSVVIFFL